MNELKEDSEVRENNMTAIFNYCLNKFCPFLIIGFLVFSNFGFFVWEPYAIIGLVVFVDRFSFKVGYSVAFCEERGIDPSHDYKDN